jgi:ATP-dependent Clp protease adapter protein ClpS
MELELELIQTQMTQKRMLRAEVHARALRASQNRKEDSEVLLHGGDGNPNHQCTQRPMRRGVCLRQGTETVSKYSVNEVVIFCFKQNNNKDWARATSVPCDVHTNVVHH